MALNPGSLPSPEPVGINVKQRFKLEKFDSNGDLFEVVKGGDDLETVATMRVPGKAPASSYATCPLKPEGPGPLKG